MQTVVSYNFDSPWSLEALSDAMNRVFRHYSELSAVPLRMEGRIGSKCGLFALVPSSDSTNWPAWSVAGDISIASVYVPIGWRRVVGNVPLADGPSALLAHLKRHPLSLAKLAPPFAMFAVDERNESVTVVNDGLGYSRIYDAVVNDARVLSSRADAASIFLGTPPVADEDGWRSLAGCGWFMGELTPFARVKHLAPGTIMTLDSRNNSVHDASVDVIGDWVTTGNPDVEVASSEVADELRNYAREVSEFWDLEPTVHLSGGRDSRATAAPFVASGVPAKFHTVASLEGELLIAEELLARVGRSRDHSVVRESDASTSGNIVDRAVQLQLAYGGIYGPAGVKQKVFPGFGRARPVVTGAAGEIGRGNFYKGAFLGRIRAEGAAGPWNRLAKLYAFHGGVPRSVNEVVEHGISAVLEDAANYGISDAPVLDYFYFAERLRRWSNASCKVGTLTPLASPAYVRGAFAQPPEAKLEETFHLKIIEKLVSEWTDVSFYKARVEDARTRTRPWLWDSGDRQTVESLVDVPDTWENYFVPSEIQELWNCAVSGEGGSRHEMLFQRLVWVHASHVYFNRIREASRADVPREFGLADRRESEFMRIVSLS